MNKVEKKRARRQLKASSQSNRPRVKKKKQNRNDVNEQRAAMNKYK